jgi:hypothetical protein
MKLIVGNGEQMKMKRWGRIKRNDRVERGLCVVK